MSKKHNMSPEGRKRIVEAQKKRWDNYNKLQEVAKDLQEQPQSQPESIGQ